MDAKEQQIRLEDFDISRKTGFLTDVSQWELPKEYAVWHQVASVAAERVKCKTFREAVEQMPVLDHRNLKTRREKHVAHLQLTLIASCYVWQDGKEGVPKALPACVSIPWWNISKDLGIQALVNHASFVLTNWKLVDTNRPWSLDNLDVLYRWPGGESAKWFSLIAVQMEKDFVDGLLHIESGIRSVLARDDENIINSLHVMQNVISKMKSTLSHMYARVAPEDFFDRLRPFLGGWGWKGSSIPEGLIFTGVSCHPKVADRGTAAQSSIFQAIDAFLGLEYTEREKDFILNMRAQMPPPHAEFIERIENGPSLRQYVNESGSEILKTAFKDCLDTLVHFRSYHMAIVRKFIVGMTERKGTPQRIATFGSTVMEFLKGFRSTTESARI